MEKKWFSRYFSNVNEVVDFLNRLSKEKVDPDNIKPSALEGMGGIIGGMVWYFHTKSVA